MAQIGDSDRSSVTAKGFFDRAISCTITQQYEEALAYYTLAIELDPTFAEALTNRGATYNELEQYDEALVDHNTAIELDPENLEAYNNRAITFCKLEQYENALLDYARAIELDPARAQTYINRAYAYEKLGRYNDALVDYTQSIKLGFDKADVFIRRGLLHAQSGNYSEAAEDFDQAILLGNEREAALATEMRRELDNIPPSEELLEQAWLAFQGVKSLDDMARLVEKYPFVIGDEFIQMVRDDIPERVDPQYQVSWYMVLEWLQQIASEKRGIPISYDPIQRGLESFVNATSRAEMLQATRQFPFMISPNFFQIVKNTIARYPPKYHIELTMRFKWLERIAAGE
jgi:Tfp pilus assembly protein PilF